MCRRHRGSGFTLIDVAIALSVVSILAAVMVPRMTAHRKNREIYQLINQTYNLADAAKWFVFYGEGDPRWGAGHGLQERCVWLDPDRPDDAEERPTGRSHVVAPGAVYHNCFADWPGQAAGQCVINDADARELISRMMGYNAVENSLFRNLWGYDLAFSGASNFTNDEVNCWFQITTFVPIDGANAFRNMVPNGRCEGDLSYNCLPPAPSGLPASVSGPSPPGFKRCCAAVPRPGREVRLAENLDFLDRVAIVTPRPPTCDPVFADSATAPCGAPHPTGAADLHPRTVHFGPSKGGSYGKDPVKPRGFWYP